MKPVKIFELKMADWMKGLSLQTSVAIAGLFSSATNIDPFEIAGMMQSSLASTVASDLSITNTPTVVTSLSMSASPKILAHSATKLYQILDGSPYTTTDKTASITITGGVRGAVVWKNRYVYSLSNQIRSTALDLSGDVQILNGSNSDGVWHPLCVGADGNLYEGDSRGIHKCILETGTAGNALNAFALETGMYVKDLLNDGRYLVIIADNNPTGDYNTTGGSTPPVPVAGKYRCQVLFWDMIKSTADQIFEFSDSYLVGAKILDGGIYVFGGDNLYITNISTFPRAIFSFRDPSTITEKPQTPYQIVQAKNSIYWCGQSNGAIYAYGSLFPGQKKIFFQPFNSTYAPSAITYNGSKFYTGTSGTDNFLQVSDTGSTRNGGTLTTAPIILSQPFKFAYIKTLMREPLASGNSVDCHMSSNNGNKEISASNSKNFSTVGPKQMIIFERKPSNNSSDPAIFEDFKLTVTTSGTTAKAVAKVEVWGIPQDPMTQII